MRQVTSDHTAGQSYASLAAAWSNQSHGNMESLIQGCHLMAGGMDLAADGVVAMKGKVLVQLGIAAAEVVARQAAAVATVGAAEAAMPAAVMPKGTTIYEGAAGHQVGSEFPESSLVGGGQQVFVKVVPLTWVAPELHRLAP